MVVDNVGIIGLGLIGGSLAKALKYYRVASHVIAYDNNPNNSLGALNEKLVDEVASCYKELCNCNVIFICTPVDSIKTILEDINQFVDKDCIITDVGSTKDSIMKSAREINLKCPFIGGHPMAGSEKAGFTAARHNLFENAYYILTPQEDNCSSHALETLKHIIESIHAIPIVLPANLHDDTVAAISHVPHIIASSLVNAVKELDSEGKYMHMLAAGGFKDLTRIASSDSKIWESICFSNKLRIISVLEHLEKEIKSFVVKLKEDDRKFITEFFDNARCYRDTFSDKHLGALLKTYDIVVDVEDVPGTIAGISALLSKYNINICNIGIHHSREALDGALEISFYDNESLQKSVDILTNNRYTVSIK